MSPARRQIEDYRAAISEPVRGRRQLVPRLSGRFHRPTLENAEPGGSACLRERPRRGRSRQGGRNLPIVPRRAQTVEQETPPRSEERLLPELPPRGRAQEGAEDIRRPQPDLWVLIPERKFRDE